MVKPKRLLVYCGVAAAFLAVSVLGLYLVVLGLEWLNAIPDKTVYAPMLQEQGDGIINALEDARARDGRYPDGLDTLHVDSVAVLGSWRYYRRAQDGEAVELIGGDYGKYSWDVRYDSREGRWVTK